MDAGEHEQLQADIADLATDRLHGEARARLVAHVAECADCSRLLDTTREIAAVVRSAGGGLLAPHPGVDELRRYALQGGPGASEALEAHARFCTSCGLEVAVWKQSSREAERPRWLRPRAAIVAAGSLAAGLVLGVLLGPWLVRRPSVPPAATPTPAPPPVLAVPWSGPVDTLHLEDTVRGEDGTPDVRVREGQPLVPLIVTIEALEQRSALGVVEISIVGDDGRSVWSSTIDTARARDGGDGALELAFLAPAAALPPGTYEARVRRTGAAAAAEPPLLQQRFRTRR